MKVLVLFYSTYGHVYRMAQAVADGAREVAGAEVVLKRVPETLSADLLKSIGAMDAQKTFATVPIATVDDLASADAIIFGTPPSSRRSSITGAASTRQAAVGRWTVH